MFFQWQIIKAIFRLLFRKKFSNRQQLLIWQNRQLQFFEKNTLKKSVYFTEKLQQFGAVENLPVMDKSLLMEHFDAMNTVGISKKEAMQVALEGEKTRDFSPKIKHISVGLSSGTSGNRGLFLVSDRERAIWVANAVFRLLFPISLKKRSIAFFLRANNNLYEAVKSRFFDFRFFDLQYPIEKNITELIDFQPHILIAPPSVLLIVASKAGDLSCVQKIISIAEVLESENKVSLEKIFRQTIHQVYQATEGFLASTCRFGTLHFHEDLLFIEKEYLDNKRFYPIITDFTRTSQPIVRYRLNDIIHERKTTCPCGSVMLTIDHIEGRSDDIFEFLDKNHKKVLLFPDFFRKAVITASETIEEYAVEQQASDLICIFLKTRYFESDKLAVTTNIQQLLSVSEITNCKLVFSEDFPVLQDKKLRRIRKNL
ncbi:MAG: hypothetical protein H7Y04_07255 [Verrucomicrobia bacterium]|nr:hypothetical protein [Cytophagales bacterium]